VFVKLVIWELKSYSFSSFFSRTRRRAAHLCIKRGIHLLYLSSSLVLVLMVPYCFLWSWILIIAYSLQLQYSDFLSHAFIILPFCSYIPSGLLDINSIFLFSWSVLLCKFWLCSISYKGSYCHHDYVGNICAGRKVLCLFISALDEMHITTSS